MSQDNRHSRNSVPDSMPPELGDIDSSWDDDIPLDESEEVPVVSGPIGPERERVTVIPLVPTEQYAARLMAEVEAADALEPEAGAMPAPPPGPGFDEPDLELQPFDDEVAGESRPAILPDEPLPELPSQPPSLGPAPDPSLSLGMSEPPRSALPISPLPAVDQDAVPTAPPPQRVKRHTSREFDDLSLDLPEPALGSPLDLVEAPERSTLNTPPLELDLEVCAASPPIDPAMADMKDRYAMGDFTGALVIAESILEGDPEDLDAQRYAQSCREVLTQMYAARLGQLEQRVTVAIPPDQIRWLSLDHRAGFLLSLIDGSSSIEELLDISGMTRLDALRILFNLVEQRVIALEPA